MRNHLIRKRKIGDMRCAIHRMPPGIRDIGVDLFMQGDGNQTDSAFLQGYCREFFDGFFILLFTRLFPDDIRS